MKAKLICLFERYWINTVIGGFCLAVLIGIGVGVIIGYSLENLRVWIGIAILLVPFALKGDVWAASICQRFIKQPRVNVIVSYRNLLGTENRNLLMTMLEIVGASHFRLYIDDMTIELGYQSPKSQDWFPLVDKGISFDRVLHRGTTESANVPLKFTDQYFQNDVLEAHSRNQALNLRFTVKYHPKVLAVWRLGIPVKYKLSIDCNQVP